MIERMVLTKRESKDLVSINSETDKEKEFFSISKNIFKSVEIKYNIIIEDYEISLIYQLLSPFI